MRLSVACTFDPELIEGLRNYPVYEVYGKLTSDFFGGGRPSFYLPEVNEKRLEKYVRLVHKEGIEFNYLLNSTCMGNVEYTSEGQRELRNILDWLSDIGVDSVTTASLLILRIIKKQYPHLKVRISSHRYTDNSRKVRFWAEEGADCIVVSEVNIYREFDVLKSIREATDVDLSLIVNNSCRQDCAIAGTHAVTLNHASQKARNGTPRFPLDYCMLSCMKIRLDEPVNFIRANWIRPEDLDLYESMGYDNFKIVERNTPTRLLLERVKAYAEKRYEGNLADLVLAWNYDSDKLKKEDRDMFSYKRMMKYFVNPKAVNIFRFWQMVELGHHQSLLYPRKGGSGIHIDNRKLDGFLDKWPKRGCGPLDCESCRYCHELASECVSIDPEYREKAIVQFDRLFEDLHTGRFWEPHIKTAAETAKKMAAKIGLG